jgi:hypothetical protein
MDPSVLARAASLGFIGVFSLLRFVAAHRIKTFPQRKPRLQFITRSIASFEAVEVSETP